MNSEDIEIGAKRAGKLLELATRWFSERTALDEAVGCLDPKELNVYMKMKEHIFLLAPAYNWTKEETLDQMAAIVMSDDNEGLD